MTTAMQPSKIRRMQPGLRRRMFVASLTLALFVGAVFAILIVTLLKRRHTQAVGRGPSLVIAQANLLEQQVLNLETDARRYAITKHGVYLTAADRRTGS